MSIEARWIAWARIALVAEGPEAAVQVLGFYLALNPGRGLVND